MDATREQLLDDGMAIGRDYAIAALLQTTEADMQMMKFTQADREGLARRRAHFTNAIFAKPSVPRRVVSGDMIAAFGPFVG